MAEETRGPDRAASSDVRPILPGRQYLVLDKLTHTDGFIRFKVRDELGDEYWVISPEEASVTRQD